MSLVRRGGHGGLCRNRWLLQEWCLVALQIPGADRKETTSLHQRYLHSDQIIQQQTQRSLGVHPRSKHTKSLQLNYSYPSAHLPRLPIHFLAFLSAQCCIAAFIALFFTRFWLLSALYAVWWFLDREQPRRGGRRIHAIRNSVVWRYMRDYFPITVSATDPIGL